MVPLVGRLLVLRSFCPGPGGDQPFRALPLVVSHVVVGSGAGGPGGVPRKSHTLDALARSADYMKINVFLSLSDICWLIMN